MPNIGIDFGTTNSVIVAYNKKKNEFTYFNFARGRGGCQGKKEEAVLCLHR